MFTLLDLGLSFCLKIGKNGKNFTYNLKALPHFAPETEHICHWNPYEHQDFYLSLNSIM